MPLEPAHQYIQVLWHDQRIEAQALLDECRKCRIDRRPLQPIRIGNVLHHGPQPLELAAAVPYQGADARGSIGGFEVHPAYDTGN